jgi:preprotein translocase subunit SecE
MALNREQKRALKKRGDLGEDGEPTRTRARPPTPPPPQQRSKEDRVGTKQFLREVRQELRKVAWPTRNETINYSVIVITTLVIMTALIFVLDWVFARGVLRLFDV